MIGSDVDASKSQEKQRIASFLADRNGPVPIFSQTKASIRQRIDHRTKIIHEAISKVKK